MKIQRGTFNICVSKDENYWKLCVCQVDTCKPMLIQEYNIIGWEEHQILSMGLSYVEELT